MIQSSGLGARIIASVAVTSFGTAFRVLVCRGGLAGACAAWTAEPMAASSVVVSIKALNGRVIAPSLGARFVGFFGRTAQRHGPAQTAARDRNRIFQTQTKRR